jgi:hypothetical protein
VTDRGDKGRELKDMAKILYINGSRGRSGAGRIRRLDRIKKELSDDYGIDLDRLMGEQPLTTLSVNDFDQFVESVLSTIDEFCNSYPDVTIQDILYALENVKEIVRETGEIDRDV